MGIQKSRRATRMRALCGVSFAAMMVYGGPASAAVITLDGLFESGQYALQYSVPMYDNSKVPVVIGNTIEAFGIDAAGNQFLYIQLPTQYVDNTYGTNASAGWTKGHQFSDLLGSDADGVNNTFTWKPTNGANAGVTQAGQIDYIADDKKGNYASGGFGAADTNTNNGMTDKNDGKLQAADAKKGILASNTNDIIGVATSLQYDLNVIDGTATTNSSLLAGWLGYVGYEIEFAAGTFDAATWLNNPLALALVTIGDPHASPSMQTFGSYGTPVCQVGCTNQPPISGVPIPASLPLFGGGLGLFGWLTQRRLRRRKKPAVAGTPSG